MGGNGAIPASTVLEAVKWEHGCDSGLLGPRICGTEFKLHSAPIPGPGPMLTGLGGWGKIEKAGASKRRLHLSPFAALPLIPSPIGIHSPRLATWQSSGQAPTRVVPGASIRSSRSSSIFRRSMNSENGRPLFLFGVPVWRKGSSTPGSTSAPFSPDFPPGCPPSGPFCRRLDLLPTSDVTAGHIPAFQLPVAPPRAYLGRLRHLLVRATCLAFGPSRVPGRRQGVYPYRLCLRSPAVSAG